MELGGLVLQDRTTTRTLSGSGGRIESASPTSTSSVRALVVSSSTGIGDLLQIWLTSHVWASLTGEGGCHAQEVPTGVQG
jgi:hypothetical protein